MGLDTSHDAWHGPYSSFNQFRTWVAAQLGINLKDCVGFTDKPTIALDIALADHDLLPFLDHSDCDGKLTPEECRRIAKGFKELLKNVPEDNTHWSNYQHAVRFMKGCIRAANAKESIDFH